MGLLDLFTRTPDKAGFAAIVLRWLEKAYPQRSFRIDGEAFRIVENAPGTLAFYLNNAYRDYCKAPRRERDHVLEKYTKSLLEGEETPGSFAAVHHRLLPVLRNRAMAEQVRLSGTGQDGAAPVIASAPFSDDTFQLVALDTEHVTMPLTERQLLDWQVSFDVAWGCALDNLRDATVASFTEFQPGLFVSAWNDAYDPSRILFPDVIHQVPLGGERIVMIPNRNHLLVASANDNAALRGMVALATHIIADEGRSLSALMYRFDGDRVVEYRPTDPTVQAALEQLRQNLLVDDYAGQKEMLDKYYEENGIDIHVATYQLMRQNESDQLVSLAVWTEDVDTLLPQADVVALVSVEDLQHKQGARHFVAWDDLQRATGQFERVDGCYPPRYKPSAFPSLAQREALPQAFTQ